MTETTINCRTFLAIWFEKQISLWFCFKLLALLSKNSQKDVLLWLQSCFGSVSVFGFQAASRFEDYVGCVAWNYKARIEIFTALQTSHFLGFGSNIRSISFQKFPWLENRTNSFSFLCPYMIDFPECVPPMFSIFWRHVAGSTGPLGTPNSHSKVFRGLREPKTQNVKKNWQLRNAEISRDVSNTAEAVRLVLRSGNEFYSIVSSPSLKPLVESGIHSS